MSSINFLEHNSEMFEAACHTYDGIGYTENTRHFLFFLALSLLDKVPPETFLAAIERAQEKTAEEIAAIKRISAELHKPSEESAGKTLGNTRDWHKEYMDYRHVVEPLIGIARFNLQRGLALKAAEALQQLCDRTDALDAAICDAEDHPLCWNCGQPESKHAGHGDWCPWDGSEDGEHPQFRTDKKFTAHPPHPRTVQPPRVPQGNCIKCGAYRCSCKVGP